MRLALLSVGAFAVVLAAACGGADAPELFDDAGNPIGDASTQPDGATPDATTNPDVVVDDAPTMVDAVTVDVPVKPADSTIQCGTMLTCSAQTQVCCHHTQSISKAYECVTSVSDCADPTDVPIGCSGVANCVSQGTPSYTCCANTANTGACETATDVSCMATCDTGGTQLKIGCSGSDPCPTDAPMCRMSTCSLPGYQFCAAN